VHVLGDAFDGANVRGEEEEALAEAVLERILDLDKALREEKENRELKKKLNSIRN
jgi:hypothetical protein